jgi:2-keto-4-pentenoate hydratase/2-oxohepta-3-ene-1,7-dioic acid hydratase in catechol pathway
MGSTAANLIWYLGKYVVLELGDLINTGTPRGVALGLPDHPHWRTSDRLELEIDGLGQQSQETV